jgi:hypothetical protein
VANLAPNVSAGRGEKRADLAPGKEHKPEEDDEPHRIVAEHVKRPDAETFHAERDEHVVFSRPIMSEIQPKNVRVRPLRSRMVAARSAVIVADSVTGTLSTQSTSIGLDWLSPSTAGADDHEHEVHQPEDRLTQHFRRPVLRRDCTRLAFTITAGTCPPSARAGRRRG